MNFAQHRHILCYFFMAILACSIWASSAANKNKNRLFGPMAGKRSNDDLKNFMGFLSDTTEDKQDTRPADYQNQKDFLQTDKTCWLDTAYSRLSPEWQEVVYKILTMAESKRS
ncbi:uncharacterized protein [Amphiura filiformis]|uniref:uncharacterized protein isoform X3 n=1 Tax=Amphiura filiformis TaxID=82378 RepID=UPI003B20E3F1